MFRLFKILLNIVKASLTFLHVGYYSIGFDQAKADPIRDKLAEKGYPAVDTQYTMHGGGMYRYVTNRLIVGGEGSGGGDTMTSGKYTVIGGGGAGRGYVGWVLRPLPFLHVYPLVGIGGGGSGLSVFAPDGDSPYTPPRDSNKVVNAENVDPLTVLIGLGLELRLGWLMLGIRAGYMQSPFATPGTPEKRPFFRVIVGGGRKR